MGKKREKTPEELAEELRQKKARRATGYAPEDPDRELTGQARMAYRLAGEYRDRLLHVHGLGWHYWDGHRWAECLHGEATRAVLDVLRSSYLKAFGDTDLSKDIQKCHSSAGISGILKIAGELPEFAATVDDLDADPLLLNVANGTLELDTLTLREPDPRDRITKMTAAAWRPDEVQAGTGRWQSFLDDVLPDPEVQGLLARYVGQALRGRDKAQNLAILTGTGGNGKGVWYGAVGFALGDYAYTPQDDMLLAKRSQSAFDGSVELRGVRWAVLSEVDAGRALAPATVKRLTGGDRITSRKLYANNITFEPSHTLAMVVNHLPEVPDTSRGMWRRLLVIPFEVEVPESKADLELGRKLQAHADEILAWCVAGLRDWYDRGRRLDPPATVLAATTAYRQNSDQLARFLDECTEPCEPAAGNITPTQLWKLYGQWIATTGETSQFVGVIKLRQALDDRGVWGNAKKNVGWTGHRPRPEWDGTSPAPGAPKAGPDHGDASGLFRD